MQTYSLLSASSSLLKLNMLHNFSDGLYAKELVLPQGTFAVQHKHTYDHLSILAKGKVQVLFEGERSKVFEAPACINIVKGINHSIMALEDSVWYCVHATDETDVEHIDEVLIKEGV
jgi:quercetin dioxygenase-like cupin family protein